MYNYTHMTTIKNRLMIVWAAFALSLMIPYFFNQQSNDGMLIFPIVILLLLALAYGSAQSYKESFLEKKAVVLFVVAVVLVYTLTMVIGSLFFGHSVGMLFLLSYLLMYVYWIAYLPLSIIYFLRSSYQILVNSDAHVGFKFSYVLSLLFVLPNFFLLNRINIDALYGSSAYALINKANISRYFVTWFSKSFYWFPLTISTFIHLIIVTALNFLVPSYVLFYVSKLFKRQ